MSEHESIRELISLAAAGVLDADEHRRVEQHVAICEVCRRELEAWQGYASELGRMPAPVAPRHLAERTRSRILAQRAELAEKRWNDVVLAVLALFAWTMGFTSWIIVRLFSGNMLALFESGFVKILIWSGASTVLAWLTAAVVAVAVGVQRRASRRTT